MNSLRYVVDMLSTKNRFYLLGNSIIDPAFKVKYKF